MKSNVKQRLLLGLALAYSAFLFFIANYLPLLTNGLAEILTWAVYAQVVRGLILFIGATILFVLFVQWPSMPRRALFLGQLMPFAALSALLLGRLGDSVNEYIHYPQYATCVVVWFLAFSRSGQTGALSGLRRKFGPLIPALAVSVMLGLAEEGYQYFAPRRRFDLQDIALNLMGVWLGAILVWIFSGSTGTEGNVVAPDSSDQ